MDGFVVKTFEVGAWYWCGGMKLTICWFGCSFCADAEAAKGPMSANSVGAVGVTRP